MSVILCKWRYIYIWQYSLGLRNGSCGHWKYRQQLTKHHLLVGEQITAWHKLGGRHYVRFRIIVQFWLFIKSLCRTQGISVLGRSIRFVANRP